MSGEPPDLAAWLRAILNADLAEWRSCKAHFLAVREKEGDYLYDRAREHVSRCRSELAILDAHAEIGRNSRSGPICNTCVNIGTDPANDDEFYSPYPCRTVRLLGYGYRFRGGYREAEWKP